jgi:transcriptional regulator with XRE-family HTH domain
MAAKRAFTDEQYDALIAAVRRALADKKRFRNQEALALALKLTQPSLSAMLHGKWRPGVTTARAIANLEGMTLEDMIGAFADDEGPAPRTAGEFNGFTNLKKCIEFYAGSKHWSPWTIAAAQAGFYGPTDFTPPQWEGKLDQLERALEKVRRGA